MTSPTPAPELIPRHTTPLLTAHTHPPPGAPNRPPNLSLLSKTRWNAKHPPSNPSVSFTGQTILVTGANTGLGFHAALKYSRLHAAKLILAVRSREKGEATKSRILTETGRDPSTISFLTVDLAMFASVVRFCAELDREVGPAGLDGALLCAGVAPPSWKAGEEGFDVAVQVNVLSTTLMAEMLLPMLQRRKEVSPGSFPHLTFVNSTGNDMVKREWLAGHGGSGLRMANDPKAWSSMRTYAVVKLVGLAVMKGMAERIGKGRDGRPEIIVNAVCPGLCKTDLGRDYPWIAQALMAPVQLLLHRTAEEGARSLVSATALGPESHGKLWHNDLLYPMNDFLDDKNFVKQTYDEVMAVVNKVPRE